MKLYVSRVSPRARRTQIAAAELGLPVTHVDLNPVQGENRTAEYLTKNPMGKIPTFEDADGWTLWESCAILVYWGEKHPERGLFPSDLRERADAFRWLFWTTAHLDPNVASLFVQKFLVPRRGNTPDANLIGMAEKELARFVPVLEAHLKTQPWMLGSAFSLVDIAVGVSLDTLLIPELGFTAAPLPRINDWVERLRARPSWGGSWPNVPP